MSATLKLYRIAVTNMRTRETLSFLGQGVSVAEALKEGMANVQASFRPRDGVTRESSRVAVTLADGSTVLRTLAEFEAQATTLPAPASEAVEMEFA